MTPDQNLKLFLDVAPDPVLNGEQANGARYENLRVKPQSIGSYQKPSATLASIRDVLATTIKHQITVLSSQRKPRIPVHSVSSRMK